MLSVTFPKILFITLGTKPIFVFLILSEFMFLVEKFPHERSGAREKFYFFVSGENWRGKENEEFSCERSHRGERKGGIER